MSEWAQGTAIWNFAGTPFMERLYLCWVILLGRTVTVDGKVRDAT